MLAPLLSALLIALPQGGATRPDTASDSTRRPVKLGGVVIAVSRRPEKITEAPAAVSIFDASQIDETLGSPATVLLRTTPGVSLSQVGIATSFVNGRGFDRSFNTRWLTLEDGRVAALAETGLQVGEHTTIPKLDIAGIEVIAGPGSALYGANAASGLMSLRTKDPRTFPGTSIEITGGTRSYMDVQLRHAAVAGRWSWKLSGERLTARDWTDTVFVAGATPNSPPIREAAHTYDTDVNRFSGSLRRQLGGGELALNAGASLRNAMGLAGLGRYLMTNYGYQDVQLAWSSPRWFAQAYGTHSNSGGTYFLGAFTQTAARFPSLSADSVRSLSSFPVDGRMLVAEVQRNDVVGWLNNSLVVYGALARRDRVSSYGRAYVDATSGEALITDQASAYGQATTPLRDNLRLVSALRFDQSDRFDGRFSPKIGLVYDVGAEQSLRLTYNEAFLEPTMLQTSVYTLNAGANLLIIGNARGFVVKNPSGAVVRTIAPISPEANTTWELGYKGILANRLYLDATLYRSRFTGFFGPAVSIANPTGASPTWAYDAETGQRLNNRNGAPLIVNTAFNAGSGSFDGIDLVARYYFTNRYALAGTWSATKISSLESNPGDPPEATAFNTSPVRMGLALEGSPRRELDINVATRYVMGYPFRSAVNWGHIPTFATLGVSARYRFSGRTSANLRLENVATCVAGRSIPPAGGISAAGQATYAPGQSCGGGMRHTEMLNMPQVGTMVMLGVRFDRR